jgi:hypothetical protein
MSLDLLAFDIVVGYLAAFVGAVLAISLIFHPYRRSPHIFLAGILILLSTGFTFQSLYLEGIDSRIENISLGMGALLRIPMWIYVFTVYVLAHFHFCEGAFTAGRVGRELLAMISFSCLTAGILFLGGVTVISQSQYTLAAVLIFVCLMTLGTLYRLLQATAVPDMAQRLLQFSEVNKTIAPFFLRDLAKLPEISRVQLLSRTDIEASHLEEIYTVLIPGAVYGQHYLKTMLNGKKLSSHEKMALKSVSHLLTQKGFQAVVCLKGSESLLLANPRSLSSAYLFEATLFWAADILKLMSQMTPPRKMAVVQSQEKLT